MALDSRSRPIRRPARRRLPLLTALVLVTMAAGLWAWLCAPAAPQAPTVAAPRLHTAAVQVDASTQVDTAAEHTAAAGHAAAAGRPFVAELAAATGSAGWVVAARIPVGVTPAAAGPRAPPVAS